MTIHHGLKNGGHQPSQVLFAAESARDFVAAAGASRATFCTAIMPVAVYERNERAAGQSPHSRGIQFLRINHMRNFIGMNTEWRDFLEQASAHLDDVNQPLLASSLEAPAGEASASDLCCNLSHLGLIAARGPESERFLQGQLTCDVRRVTPEHSLIGAHCNPKGRALSSFRLFQRDDTYYLELPQTMTELALGHLRKYLLIAKATLEDASDALVRMGVSGLNAAHRVESVLGSIPEVENSVVTVDGITVIRLPGQRPRFELHGTAQQLMNIWNALVPHTRWVESEAWRQMDILAGIPTIYPETTGVFVPQMINLQRLDGISFQKGCYIGQEIVARTHYLGKLKRRMYLARVESPTPPCPGDSLFSPQADPSQSAGQLVDAYHHPSGGYAVLATALIQCAEHGVLRLGDADGPALCLESLPYSLDEEAT